MADLLSMTRLLRPASLFALLGTLALLAGCGGSSGSDATAVSGEPISFEQLSQAATTSADASSGRFSFAMETTMPGTKEPFAFTGDGAFDAEGNRVQLSVDFSAFAQLLGGMFSGLGGQGAGAGPDFGDPDAWKIDAVQDGTVFYMRFPALASELPAGKSWVRMDLAKAGRAQGFDLTGLENLTSNDPRQMLDVLRAASDEIETVGPEVLDGVSTTHYRAQVDLAEYAKLGLAKGADANSMLDDVLKQSGLESMPVDVWLDDAGLVRKVEMTFSGAPPGSTESLDASMRFELSDYGEPVAVDVPPAAEVVDTATLD